MHGDKADLLKYGGITVLLIVGCFALVSVSNNILVQMLLGWVGVGVIALYFRWLHKNKLHRRTGD